MLKQLHLKIGSSTDQPPLLLDTKPSVTVFVGPNNAGKSQALREIFSFCQTGQLSTSSVIVGKLTFEAGDEKTVRKELEACKVLPTPAQHLKPGHARIRMPAGIVEVVEEQYVAGRTNPEAHTPLFAKFYLKHFTLNLDGASRIGLVNAQERGSLEQPSSPLARLLCDDAKREALRKTLYDAFQMYLALNAQSGNEITIRYGTTPPLDERSFNSEAVEYMRNARDVSNVSDGVKAFTGILLQLSVGDPRIIIIDEPEAFLHPSLAFKLGKEIAKGAFTEGKYVFVATHSPQFIMGAIVSGARVNIVRLTYHGGVGTARLLAGDELTTLMQDPLLRSVGVLSGLFYDNVIVGEADADRAFYQEINERLLAANDPRGIQHVLFLNAVGKDTIPKIIEPLRRLGIPAAAITDIDIICQGGNQWTRHLKACSIPELEHQPYGTRRSSALKVLEGKNLEYKRAGGINILGGSDRQLVENLFNDLARYGLFVVPRGEVEAWLSNLNVPRSKEGWLRSVFERMGSDPTAKAYVQPDAGDVWEFMGKIRNWLENPNRHGVPD